MFNKANNHAKRLLQQGKLVEEIQRKWRLDQLCDAMEVKEKRKEEILDKILYLKERLIQYKDITLEQAETQLDKFFKDDGDQFEEIKRMAKEHLKLEQQFWDNTIDPWIPGLTPQEQVLGRKPSLF